MTQAFNLAQLANNLNTSGQLDATDGLNGLVANANLASSGSASSSTYLRGDRTWSALPSLGKILQVVQTVKTNTFSTTSVYPSWVDVTGMSLTITPSSASSRILILSTNSLGNNINVFNYIRLMRNSTELFVGDAATSRASVTGMYYMNNDGTIGTVTINYVDSPATTSATTYKIQQCAATGGGTVYYNISSRDAAAGGYDSREASSIIAMEIAP